MGDSGARNGKAVRRLTGLGFELGSIIDLADKRAQLAFLAREKFEMLLPVS